MNLAVFLLVCVIALEVGVSSVWILVALVVLGIEILLRQEPWYYLVRRPEPPRHPVDE